MKPIRRGLVCVATGAYVDFVKQLRDAVEGADLADVVFLLTDSDHHLKAIRQESGCVPVLALPWGRLPWPYPTLWRYHAIAMYGPHFLSEVSHLVYIDVDMRPVLPCPELFGDRVFAVRHPGFYLENDHRKLPFERSLKSAAAVRSSRESIYVAGGVQGGPVEAYLEAVGELRDRCTGDYLAGVQAQWHDESHWNRYVSDNAQSIRVLPPDFCWPEAWDVPSGVSPRILALDKDHHALRGTNASFADGARGLAATVKGRLLRRRI